METAILVLIFPVAVWAAWKYFLAEQFGGCGKKSGCSCHSGGSSFEKYIEEEKRKKATGNDR